MTKLRAENETLRAVAKAVRKVTTMWKEGSDCLNIHGQMQINPVMQQAMNVNDSFLLNVLTGDTITKIGVGGALTDWVSTFILDCQEIQAWRNKNETTI